MVQPEIPGTNLGKVVMPYGSDGSNWIALLVSALGELKVIVESSAIPSGAATQATLALCLTALEKIDDLQGALASEETDLLRVESKDGDKLFGFESIVEEELNDDDLAAGTNFINGTPVDANKIWHFTQLSVYYQGTGGTNLWVVVVGLAGDLFLVLESTPVSGKWYVLPVDIYMQVGDYLQVGVETATLHDDLILKYNGVQMNAP